MSDDRSTPNRDPFPATRWSLVLKAQDDNAPEAARALADLCRDYWFPLYAYVRRRRSAQDAEDLTQAFFERLIAKNDLKSVDQNRGKLRAYLLTALKHFLADQHDRDTALKRGGGTVHFSIDADAAEQRYRPEPADDSSPDAAFDRRWALSLLEAVIADLRAEYIASGKTELFDTLRPFLTNPNEDAAAAAKILEMTPNNIRVTVFRLRRRYGDLLRQHIAETLAPGEDVEAELNHLLLALRG